MAFDEVRFPDSIAQGSSSGPSFKTNIADSASGSEGRTSVWSKGRLTFDIAYGIHKAAELAQVIAFFRACAGKARGFRFKDYSDYTSASDGVSSPAFTDQLIGTGDGSTATFQLTKTYASGSITSSRDIVKPVANKVYVGIDGTEIDVADGSETVVSFGSRTTVGTYWDENGDLQTAAAYTARYTYNPKTLAYEGLLIEPWAVNWIYNNVMDGAVVGTIGSAGSLPSYWELNTDSGLTTEIIASGTENNLNYIDIRFSGTTTATRNNYIRMHNIANAHSYSYPRFVTSAFMRLTAGSLSNLNSLSLGIQDYDGGNYLDIGDDLRSTVNTTDSLSATRQEHYTLVSDNTSTNNYFMIPVIVFNVTTGTTIDFTLRIATPQIESCPDVVSTVATSPIINDGGQSGRAADITTTTVTKVAFTVDTTTGLVTINEAPSTDALITAGFEFDVPVRFKDDNLSISLQHIKSGSASIELTEVRI